MSHKIKMTEYVRPRGRKQDITFACGKSEHDAWKKACTAGVGFSCEYYAVSGEWVLWIKPPYDKEFCVVTVSIPFEIRKRYGNL